MKRNRQKPAQFFQNWLSLLVGATLVVFVFSQWLGSRPKANASPVVERIPASDIDAR